MGIVVADFQAAAGQAWANRTNSGLAMRPLELFVKNEFIKEGMREDPPNLHTCPAPKPANAAAPAKRPKKAKQYQLVDPPDRFSYALSEPALGAYLLKQVDVWYRRGYGGPLAAVSLKSMMSSIGQNVNNRWEETVGESANMHTRFPMLVFGYLIVIPEMSKRWVKKVAKDEPIIDPHTRTPTDLAVQLETKLLAIRGRVNPVEQPSLFEEVALAVFDFTKPIPALNMAFPAPGSPLRVEEFFTNLANRYRERNRFI